jgi:predicted acetyltransferase
MALEIVSNPDPALLVASCELMSESLGFAFGDAAATHRFIETEGPENFRIAVDRDSPTRRRVVGVLTFQPTGQFFGGACLKSGAVRCVGVAPELRGRGILRELMTHTLRELRESGVPLSVLYASSPKAYRAFGYEYAGSKVSRQTEIANLAEVAAGGARLRVELLHEDRLPEVREVYARTATRQNGFIDRGDWWWLRQQGRPGLASKPRYYGFFRGDSLEGYSLLMHDYPHLRMLELVAESADAMQSALAHAYSHRSIFSMLDWLSGGVDPIALHLPSPLGDVGPPPSRYSGPVDEWMLRLLSPQDAIAACRYPQGLTAELHLSVVDRLYPNDGGPIRIQVEGGRARVSPGGRGTITVDARALASLFGHHYSVAALARAGLILGGNEREREALGSVFAGEPAWMADAF